MIAIFKRYMIFILISWCAIPVVYSMQQQMFFTPTEESCEQFVEKLSLGSLSVDSIINDWDNQRKGLWIMFPTSGSAPLEVAFVYKRYDLVARFINWGVLKSLTNEKLREFVRFLSSDFQPQIEVNDSFVDYRPSFEREIRLRELIVSLEQQQYKEAKRLFTETNIFNELSDKQLTEIINFLRNESAEAEDLVDLICKKLYERDSSRAACLNNATDRWFAKISGCFISDKQKIE